MFEIGAKFGKLTIVGEGVSKNGRRFPCRCNCGNPEVVWVNVTNLRQRAESNGGCVACATPRTHGYGSSRNPTYSVYQAMKQRCVNPNHVSWDNYGGRGIKVCERWMNSFEAFLEDMGVRPPGMTIERNDSNGDYEPGNCRWATSAEQAQNTRQAIKVKIGELEFATMTAAALHFGVSPALAKTRRHLGWPVERAVTTPANPVGIRFGKKETA